MNNRHKNTHYNTFIVFSISSHARTPAHTSLKIFPYTYQISLFRQISTYCMGPHRLISARWKQQLTGVVCFIGRSIDSHCVVYLSKSINEPWSQSCNCLDLCTIISWIISGMRQEQVMKIRRNKVLLVWMKTKKNRIKRKTFLNIFLITSYQKQSPDVASLYVY